MFIVHVSIRVKEEYISAFREATIENGKNSLNEAGVARFDVLQKHEHASEFLLTEAYYSPEDQIKHRETEHFKKWRATISDMLAEPITFIKYDNSFPDHTGWEVK